MLLSHGFMWNLQISVKQEGKLHTNQPIILLLFLTCWERCFLYDFKEAIFSLTHWVYATGVIRGHLQVLFFQTIKEMCAASE